jgi:hypothetical protein
MDPQSETSAMIHIVGAIAPWVWPATAAILVGGLVVVSSLTGTTRQPVHSEANSEIRSDVRAN